MITRTLDLDRPSDARVHDYMLGGGSNFAADRALARRILAKAPYARLEALAARGLSSVPVGELVRSGRIR